MTEKQSYLIDTNILIGLEDNSAVKKTYANFSRLAQAHNVDVFVHEAAKDDIKRDNNAKRQKVSLSKIEKYRTLKKTRGLTKDDLVRDFGALDNANDVVDATLLRTLNKGAVDFLVTQDRRLHRRARNHSAELGTRVLFIGDAVELLIQTYEPKEVSIRHVEDVMPHEIESSDPFFDSLREGYPEFDDWWREKCIKEHRPCWAVFDGGDIAGLIVRKDETAGNTDAKTKAKKILKICTFKVAMEKRGIRLGELLLKQVLWYAQKNNYDLAYVTAFKTQEVLIYLLEFYGFQNTDMNERGEFIYEKGFSKGKLLREDDILPFDLNRKHYPRFLMDEQVQGYIVPIKEDYHDILYPDIPPHFLDTYEGLPKKPGNTIRKVYLCRSPTTPTPPGSVLFFYKTKSQFAPSQALTAIGILENVKMAESTSDLMQMSGGRSVYSKKELIAWRATKARPVKVLNYLLVGYIDDPINLDELISLDVIHRPPQTIYKIRKNRHLSKLLKRANLDFDI